MSQSRVYVLTLAAMLGVPLASSAQQNTDPVAQTALLIRQRATEIRSFRAKAATTPLRADETPNATVNLARDFEPIYLRVYVGLMPQGSDAALLALEERRADKQIGDASGATAGSTSLVSKGGTPAVLAIAVENGALTQDVSGTTVTFRGTPVSLLKSFGKTGYFQTLHTTEPVLALLQRFSFAASFDTSRGFDEGAQPAFTGNRNQFAGASARFTAIDHKDPRAAVNDRRWNEFAPTTAALNIAAGNALTAMSQDPAITAWIAQTNKAIEAAPLDQVESVVIAQFRALSAAPVSENTKKTIREAGSQFEQMLKRRAEVLDDIAGGAQFVFDWNYQRPATGPEADNFKVVGSMGRSVLLTANAAVTIYQGTLIAGVDRVRDIQGAVQFDIPLGDPEALGRYVISLSGKVQHMPKDVVAGVGTLFPGTKGTIWLGQAKLTVPVKGTAAKIPLSVTVANRTELIAEKKVFARANIGLTYDLDAVLARFKP
jgi:hypothetical protein